MKKIYIVPTLDVMELQTADNMLVTSSLQVGGTVSNSADIGCSKEELSESESFWEESSF